MKTKESEPKLQFHPILQRFCVSNKEKKSDGMKLTPTQHLPDIGCTTLPTTDLTLRKFDDTLSKIEIQDVCGSKQI